MKNQISLFLSCDREEKGYLAKIDVQDLKSLIIYIAATIYHACSSGRHSIRATMTQLRGINVVLQKYLDYVDFERFSNYLVIQGSLLHACVGEIVDRKEKSLLAVALVNVGEAKLIVDALDKFYEWIDYLSKQEKGYMPQIPPQLFEKLENWSKLRKQFLKVLRPA